MPEKLTARQYDKKFQELIQRIKKRTFLFTNDSPEKQRIRKDRALNKFFYFKKTYFPHYVTKPSGYFHRQLHKYSELNKAIVAIAGPKKHGKTVDLGVIKPIWKALRGDIHYAVFISANQKLATERTLAIKIEFLYNDRIKNDFGEQIKDTASDSEFVIMEGIKFQALGWEMPIRGKIFGPFRPDYEFIDEFEDVKAINPAIARKKLRYVREDAYGALPDDKGIVIWVGNNTNKHSAFNYFKQVCKESKSDSLIFKTYKAIKSTGKPLWSFGFTIEQLEHEREVMGNAGFERSMQNNPIIEGIIFKGSWYRYFNRTNYKPKGKVLTLCDPSLGQKKSDFQAIVSIEQVSAILYRILHLRIRREPILDMIRHLYWIDKNYDTEIWLESNFWQILLLDYVPIIAKEMGYMLPVFTYISTTNKKEDILKMQPLYQRGHIEHYSPKCPDLQEYEEQLGLFDPEGSKAKDDGPDVVSRTIKRFKVVALGISGRVGLPLVSETFRKMP